MNHFEEATLKRSGARHEGESAAQRRALDIHEGEEIDAPALKALSRAAGALNTSGG